MRLNFPKKHLGQHFLVDANAGKRIITACDLKKTDIILEIGPGQGALTKRISEKVQKIYCIEIDSELCKKLQDQFDSTHVTVIHADFLKYDLNTLPKGIKVIGNLPYNISTPIIEKLLANRNFFCDLFLTVQLEFGQRLAAKVNSKDYGALSCFVQYYSAVKLLFKIKNTSFRPVPKVTSCFLRLSLRPPIDQAKNEDRLFRIIRQAFGQRRKKISNTLLPILGKERGEAILKDLRINKNLRAENLMLLDYVNIANRIP